MNTLVSISFNTNINSRSLTAYKIEIGETDEAVTNHLTQIGPVYNNHVHYRGIYATQRATLTAVIDYLNLSCSLVETTYLPTDDNRISLEPIGTQGGYSKDGLTFRTVLARKSPKGIFVRDAA